MYCMYVISPSDTDHADGDGRHPSARIYNFSYSSKYVIFVNISSFNVEMNYRGQNIVILRTRAISNMQIRICFAWTVFPAAPEKGNWEEFQSRRQLGWDWLVQGHSNHKLIPNVKVRTLRREEVNYNLIQLPTIKLNSTPTCLSRDRKIHKEESTYEMWVYMAIILLNGNIWADAY